MLESGFAVRVFAISEFCAIFLYTILWFRRRSDIRRLPAYLAYAVLIGFLSFVINLLVAKRYETHYILHVLVAFSVSTYMMRSKIMNNLIQENR